MRGRFGVVAAVVALACALVVAACGGSSGGGGGSASTSGGGGQQTTKGAKVIDPNSMNGAKGNVTYCVGRDTTGFTHKWIKAYNAKNTGITVKILEFPQSA